MNEKENYEAIEDHPSYHVEQEEKKDEKIKVGDILKCVKEPDRYKSPLRVGEIYEVFETSDIIYYPNQAIQLAGGCYGGWYLPSYFEKLTLLKEKERELTDYKRMHVDLMQWQREAKDEIVKLKERIKELEGDKNG